MGTNPQKKGIQGSEPGAAARDGLQELNFGISQEIPAPSRHFGVHPRGSSGDFGLCQDLDSPPGAVLLQGKLGVRSQGRALLLLFLGMEIPRGNL